jgi:hypothetical protein
VILHRFIEGVLCIHRSPTRKFPVQELRNLQENYFGLRLGRDAWQFPELHQ